MKKLDYLIAQLLEENPGLELKQLPSTTEEKKALFRSLCNIRPPVPISKEFLQIQDVYLQEELQQKEITDVSYIKTIQECFPNSLLKHPDKIAIWKGDITTLKIEAIVNAANSQMLGCFVPMHSCIDNAIHSNSGIQLRLECNSIIQKQGKEEETGKVKLTSAYNLPCQYILHTVGPITNGNPTKQQEQELKSCYQSCLELALEKQIQTLAFCSISTGVFLFPIEKASRIAINTIDHFLDNYPKSFTKIVIDLYKEEDYDVYQNLLQ